MEEETRLDVEIEKQNMESRDACARAFMYELIIVQKCQRRFQKYQFQEKVSDLKKNPSC